MSELQNVMQKDISILQTWLSDNVLTMNTMKTKYMTFGKSRRQPDLNLRADGQIIERVREYKYLGLFLDENLKFDKHIDHTKKLIRPFSALMRRHGRFIPIEKRKQLYFAYVQSHITYMMPIYADCSNKKLDQLQTIQNSCIKAMYGLPRLTSTTYLYSKSIVPIKVLATVERVTNIWIMRNSMMKHNFTFTENSTMYAYNTKSRNLIHSFNPHGRRVNSDTPDHPALVLAIGEYNRLDTETLQMRSTDTFKARLKLKLMSESDKFSAISPYYFIN